MIVKEYKRSENGQKIIDAMHKVHDNLIAYKNKMNSELVVIKDDKIVWIKP